MYFGTRPNHDELISLDKAKNYCAFRAAHEPIKSNWSRLSLSGFSVELALLARNASELQQVAADGSR
jgi:hypothetical protein